ncbi:MAG TPA: hypothetical protein VM925_12450 [Labilithrix sp.]|nr:hypothetical protein [Labilithrix sp.]
MGAVNHMIADDAALYFATDQGIVRVPLTGGAPAGTQWAASQIHAIALANDSIYSIEYDRDKKRGRVMTGSKRGGGARQLWTLAAADLGFDALAGDDDAAVYWLAGKKLSAKPSRTERGLGQSM